ncbi:uncharacterized protein LOC144615798 [Panthera onca]
MHPEAVWGNVLRTVSVKVARCLYFSVYDAGFGEWGDQGFQKEPYTLYVKDNGVLRRTERDLLGSYPGPGPSPRRTCRVLQRHTSCAVRTVSASRGRRLRNIDRLGVTAFQCLLVRAEGGCLDAGAVALLSVASQGGGVSRRREPAVGPGLICRVGKPPPRPPPPTPGRRGRWVHSDRDAEGLWDSYSAPTKSGGWRSEDREEWTSLHAPSQHLPTGCVFEQVTPRPRARPWVWHRQEWCRAVRVSASRREPGDREAAILLPPAAPDRRTRVRSPAWLCRLALGGAHGATRSRGKRAWWSPWPPGPGAAGPGGRPVEAQRPGARRALRSSRPTGPASPRSRASSCVFSVNHVRNSSACVEDADGEPTSTLKNEPLRNLEGSGCRTYTALNSFIIRNSFSWFPVTLCTLVCPWVLLPFRVVIGCKRQTPPFNSWCEAGGRGKR